MRFTQVAAASLVAPLVAAHGMEGMPRIVGMPRQLRAGNPFAGFKDHHIAHPDPIIRPRQSADGRCGPDGGNQKCADNECCSSAGYCGTTKEHCQAPDCLFNFGPACGITRSFPSIVISLLMSVQMPTRLLLEQAPAMMFARS